MKEFEKWQKSRAFKTVGFLNTFAAYKAGEKEGWKAALEWIYSKLDYSIEHKEIKNIIEDELDE
jgi:hypothetical protein